ncbi:MAG: chemotaxis protein CheX [Planctomycetes bacterium]|nr:chemotaxis protein CheX [Planctomycetota bacterium]
MIAKLLGMDDTLVTVLVRSAQEGLAMADLLPRPIGLYNHLPAMGDVSAMVGFAGPVSGSMLLNTSGECARYMTERMVGEPRPHLDGQVLDGLCEIVNIIAGQTKAALSATAFRFDRIGVPSAIVGNSYFISHYRGMTSATVEFDLPDRPIRPGERGAFAVNISLMNV